MAAIMTICGAIMVLTSCADNDDTPTSTSEVYIWAQTYVMGYLLLELENFYGDYNSPEAAPARRKVANIMRNAYMAGQPKTAQTRSTTVNGVELDWEHVNTWPEEQQNAVMFDGFAQSGDNELFLMNAAATLDADSEVAQPQNDYEWGNKADAMVDWLNRQGKENAQTRAVFQTFRLLKIMPSGLWTNLPRFTSRPLHRPS